MGEPFQRLLMIQNILPSATEVHRLDLMYPLMHARARHLFDEVTHRKKDKQLSDFAASAMDEIQIVDHDHYLDSAAANSTEFEWTKKEPGYWQAVLDAVHTEENRRATKAKKLASTTKDDWVAKVKAFVHAILTRTEWKP